MTAVRIPSEIQRAIERARELTADAQAGMDINLVAAKASPILSTLDRWVSEKRAEEAARASSVVEAMERNDLW